LILGSPRTRDCRAGHPAVAAAGDEDCRLGGDSAGAGTVLAVARRGTWTLVGCDLHADVAAICALLANRRAIEATSTPWSSRT
jgi:hypothetical protein